VDSAELRAADNVCIAARAVAYGVDLEAEAAGARAWLERDLQTVGARLRRAHRMPQEPGDAVVEPTTAVPQVEDTLAAFERTQPDGTTNGTYNGTQNGTPGPYSTHLEGWDLEP
jgi:hypothetical protein